MDLKFIEKFDEVLTLTELKENPDLENMLVVRRGQRLSIQPVELKDFKKILKLGL